MSGSSGLGLVKFLIFGLEIPSFFILEIRVVLGNPNRIAAPSGPPIIHAASSNARKIRDLVQSLKVDDLELMSAGFVFNGGVESKRGRGLGSTSSFDRMT